MTNDVRGRRFVWFTMTLAAVWMAVGTGGITAGQAGSRIRIDGEARDWDRRQRFTHDSVQVDEELTAARTAAATEAPTGYDNLTNGFDLQGPAFSTLTGDTVTPLASFNDNRFIFEEVEGPGDGLGPTYNAQSCRECHQNVVTGGASQVTEQRAGHLLGGTFFESLGGSLIQSRAIYPEATELVAVDDDVRTFRISTNTLGLGFVEAIANRALLGIQDAQPAALRGSVAVVPILEAHGRSRIGRFGWKDQHASLESFAADAYLNEMGIMTPLLPIENSISGGGDPADFDPIDDPEDDGVDVKAFANFMRATKPPSRGATTAAVRAGEQVFASVGCGTCHVGSITTAPAGTVVNGGELPVRPALGNKVIHPYSDFLLHDIGSGDGIPIQPTPEYASTANQIRTAPLWGLRTGNRLMHDGLSFTRQDAILRHAAQASAVTRRYRALSSGEQQSLMAFLNSL